MTEVGGMRKVLDVTTRTWHWMFAGCFAGAYLTAESETLRLLHVTLGYTLAGLLVFRVCWGMMGPRHVRLSAMIRKLKGLATFKQAYQDGQIIRAANLKLTVNLMMTLVVMALLLFVIPITLSGYGIYNDLAGHWLEEVHEFMGELMLMMVFAHLVLIVLASFQRKTNMALAMWSGFQPGNGPDLIKHDHRVLAWLLMMSALAWAIVYLFVVH